MKFPKLKNTGWCRAAIVAAILLPGVIFFGYIGLMCLFGDTMGTAGFIGFLVIIIGLIPVEFSMMAPAIAIEAFLTRIYAWKRDYKKYKSDINGIGRAEITRRISGRCKGEDYEPTAAQHQPVVLKYLRGYGKAEYSYSDNVQMIFEAEHLDGDTFRDIIRDAGTQFADVLGRIPVKTTEVKYSDGTIANLQPARVCAAVILADSVDEQAAKLAREKVSCEKGYLLPCAVDCNEGIYYLDAAMINGALMPFVEEKTFAHMIAEEILFGRVLPKGEDADREPFDLGDPNITPDMSMWEFIGYWAKELRDDRKKTLAEGERLMETMRDGETHIDGDTIFCRIGDRMADVGYLDDEDCEGRKMVYIDNRWLIPKKRKISKTDSENLRRIVAEKLRSEGIDFAFADDDITTVRQSIDRRNDK